MSFTASPTDRYRLSALVRDRNAPQKHVRRAEIGLLSAEGVGTVEIMRQTGKSKTCVWRWQERFAAEGYEGLLRQDTAVAHSAARPLGRRARGGAHPCRSAGRDDALGHRHDG